MNTEPTAPAADPGTPAAPGTKPEPTPTPTTPAPAAERVERVDQLPDWAQREIAELRKENANHREAKQKAADAATKAEEQRLEAERKFEELAQQRQARIAELEPIADRYNALAAKLTAEMEAEIAKLPDEIKNMRPAGADLDDLIDWTERAKTLAAKMTAAQAAGAGPMPRPANGTTRPASNQAAQIGAMRARF